MNLTRNTMWVRLKTSHPTVEVERLGRKISERLGSSSVESKGKHDSFTSAVLVLLIEHNKCWLGCAKKYLRRRVAGHIRSSCGEELRNTPVSILAWDEPSMFLAQHAAYRVLFHGYTNISWPKRR